MLQNSQQILMNSNSMNINRPILSISDPNVNVPNFFGPINCKNLLIENVKFLNSIFWNIAPIYCENIIIRGVEVSNEGLGRTDGIDIDSSKNALIEFTTLDCDDDAFTLKSGRGKDGKLRNKGISGWKRFLHLF